MRLSSSPFGCRSLAFTLLVATMALLPARARAQSPYDCNGATPDPVLLEITPDATPLTPGSAHVLHGRLWAQAPLDSIHLDLSATGPVTLTGPTGIDLGSLAEGDSIDFTIPVSYDAAGSSDVHVDVSLALSTETSSYAAFDFYALVRTPPLDSEYGMDSPDLVSFEADEADSSEGLITPAQTDSLEDALVETPNDDVVDSSGTSPALAGPARLRPDGTLAAPVTVVGNFSWLDSKNKPHPVVKATVQLWDHETIGADRLLATDVTDENGQVSFTVPNDDGLFGGGIDAYLRIYTRGPFAYLHPYQQRNYVGTTNRIDNLSDNKTYTFNITLNNKTDPGTSWSVFTGLSQTGLYAQSLNAGTALPQLDVEFPLFTGNRGTAAKPRKVKNSSFSASLNTIYVLRLDRWDWDVVMHEYGHYVQAQFDMQNNPGGPHSTPCLSVEQGSKDNGVRMAWGEGWATYYSLVGQQVRNLGAQNIPYVGDDTYDDEEDLHTHISLEQQSNKYVGEDCETAVARVFWDLYDPPADGYENVVMSHQTLFDRMKAAKPRTLSDAWAALRAATANAGEDLALAGVVCNHQVAPVPSAPADNAVVTPGTTFSWPRAVGCSNNLGDRFDMVFFKPGNPPTRLAPIASMTGLANPTHDLTQAEFDALLPQVDANQNLLWAVEARSTAAPATGPYLGITRTVKLNAPVATQLALASADATPQRVLLAWEGATAGGAAAGVERRVAGADWQSLGAPRRDGDDRLVYEDDAVTPGTRYDYRLAIDAGGAVTFTADAWVSVPAAYVLALEGFRPNPAGASPSVAFTQPDAAPATLDVLDVAGRRVLSREVGSLGAGRHLLTLGSGSVLAPGLYLVRLRHGAQVVTARGVVIQ